jgi:hypothetical protein
MRLNETADEFENVKSTNAVEKFKVALSRLASAQHRDSIIEDQIDKFENSSAGYEYKDTISDEAKKKGQVGFPARDRRGTPRLALYNPLTPKDTQILDMLFKKHVFLKDTITALQKNITTLKRNAMKEAGTFVSVDLRTKLESNMAHEIKQHLQTIGGNAFKFGTINFRSRPGRGDTQIFIQTEGVPSEVLFTPTKEKVWKNTLDKLKDDLHKWFVHIGLDKKSRVSWGWEYDYKPTGNRKKNAGNLEIRLVTNLITDRYKKLGKW